MIMKGERAKDGLLKHYKTLTTPDIVPVLFWLVHSSSDIEDWVNLKNTVTI